MINRPQAGVWRPGPRVINRLPAQRTSGAERAATGTIRVLALVFLEGDEREAASKGLKPMEGVAQGAATILQKIRLFETAVHREASP